MAGYGIAEARIETTGRPHVAVCRQCEDTGFIQTATGLKGCPLCEDDIEQARRAGKRG